ncbi:MAG: hypothetical protein K1X92_05895 [Bacteroidia bacterium]|nr:hypothetical protein [Bacteroidia bacterium]
MRTRYQIVGTGWMDIPVGGSISISGAIKLPHSGGALNVRLNGKASTFEATLSPETNCNGSVGIAQNEEFNSILFLDFDTITT